MIQGKWLYDPEAPPPDMPLHLHDVWQRGTSQPIPDQFKRNAKAQVLHRANWMGFMDDRLCQRTPTLYLADTGNRWGYYLYENGNGSADVLISAVQELVEACRAGSHRGSVVVGQLGLGPQPSDHRCEMIPERTSIPIRVQRIDRTSGGYVLL
jgi:hypothetical protein